MINYIALIFNKYFCIPTSFLSTLLIAEISCPIKNMRYANIKVLFDQEFTKKRRLIVNRLRTLIINDLFIFIFLAIANCIYTNFATGKDLNSLNLKESESDENDNDQVEILINYPGFQKVKIN